MEDHELIQVTGTIALSGEPESGMTNRINDSLPSEIVVKAAEEALKCRDNGTTFCFET